MAGGNGIPAPSSDPSLDLAGVPGGDTIAQLLANPLATTSAPAQGFVYMGNEALSTTPPQNMFEIGHEPHGIGPQLLTTDQANMRPYMWSQKTVDNVIKKMNNDGFKVGSFEDMVSLWGQLVDRASKTYAATNGNRLLTPWDVLDLEAKAIKKAESSTPGSPGGPPRTETQTSTYSVSPDNALAAMKSAAENLLGRAPTEAEVNELLGKAQYQAQQNPTVTHVTSQTDTKGHTSVHETTDQGYNGSDIADTAEAQAMNAPDYGAYQAASTYMNALLGALGPVA